MDHEHAIAAQVPERYVFGELPRKERDEFEEHLADCSYCLQDVTTAQAFAANTREVFRGEAVAVEARPVVLPVKPGRR
jgi:anti-sigma factor RsiW